MTFSDDSITLEKITNNTGNNPYVTPGEKFRLVLNLSPTEIQTVRSSWSQMQKDTIHKEDDEEEEEEDFYSSPSPSTSKGSFSSLFCHQFYTNLLGLDPNLEAFFPSIKHQAASFAGVLQMAILHLEDLSALDDYLDSLGKRHSRVLGIEPPQFDLMGAALIKTFSDRFGSKFTAHIEDVWVKVYSYLANTILQNGAEDYLKISEDPFFDFTIDGAYNDYESRSNSARSSGTSSYLNSSTTFDNASFASSATSNNDPDYLAINNKYNSETRPSSRFTSRKPSNKNLKNISINTNNSNFNSNMPKSPSGQIFADLVVPGVSPTAATSSNASTSSSKDSDKISEKDTATVVATSMKNAMKLSSSSRFSSLKNVMRLEKSKRISTIY